MRLMHLLKQVTCIFQFSVIFFKLFGMFFFLNIDSERLTYFILSFTQCTKRHHSVERHGTHTVCIIIIIFCSIKPKSMLIIIKK